MTKRILLVSACMIGSLVEAFVCLPSFSLSAHTAQSRTLSAVTTTSATNDEKIKLAQEFLLNGNGFYAAPKSDLFSEEFVFRAPVVGPLCKKDYINTMSLFSLWTALPDMEANAYGWCVDPTPEEEGTTTVRVFVRNTGTHSGELNVGSTILEPTGTRYEGTVEALSITIDDKNNKVKKLTAGYVVDRFAGNGSGLGAVAGILSAMGLPVPKPYGKVFSLSMWLGNTFGSQFGPKTISADSDIPSWYTSPERGNENL